MNEFKKFLEALSDEDVQVIHEDSRCGYLIVWFVGEKEKVCTLFYEVDKTVGACKERAYEIYERLGGNN